MPRNIVQDVLPPERRSIRNIPLPASRRPITPLTNKTSFETDSPAETFPENDKVESTIATGGRSNNRIVIWSLAVVAILVLFVVLSSVFGTATVEVKPHQEKYVINTTVTAMKDGSAIDSADLVYSIASMSGSAEKEIMATGTEQVSEKAFGKIVIYNNFSSSPQKLITNTRFETKDGLIYRIIAPVTVPGQTKKDGASVPGSLEVTVYADAGGEKYNIGLSDFTIPGFKGDPRYETIYARSKTPMEGGFVGLRTKVSASAKKAVALDLDKAIQTELLAKTEAQVPAGFIIFNSAVEYVAGSIFEKSATEVGAIYKSTGTLSAALFSAPKLADLIISKILPDEVGKVRIANLGDLSVVPQGNEWRPLASSTTFTISGEPLIIWQIDSELLKSELAGVSKGDLDSVLSKYPRIEPVRASTWPFWKQKLPSNPNKIKIVEVLN